MHDDPKTKLEDQLRTMAPADPPPALKARLTSSLQASETQSAGYSDGCHDPIRVSGRSCESTEPAQHTRHGRLQIRSAVALRYRYLALAAAIVLVGGVILTLALVPNPTEHTSVIPPPQEPTPELTPEETLHASDHATNPPISETAAPPTLDVLATKPPTIFTLQQAFRQSPEALETLLDHTPRPPRTPRAAVVLPKDAGVARRASEPITPLTLADARRWAQLELEPLP